ncbi:MAG: COX15/CtaA family protein [Candidatus Poseidoniaceae archaeon]|nr:COX15/CtaA family protein [Candidatus Poseidoniaceae archaeon]
MEERWYRRPSSLPLVIAVMALVIVVIGGTIRVLDAGESCPDWPQCFGTWSFDVSESEQTEWYESNPDEYDSRGADYRYTALEIFVEWAHRLLASIMAIPVLANFLLIRKHREKYGDNLVNISFATGILLIVQGIAGAVTVNYDNADWTVALHLVLALSFVSILIWQFLSMSKIEGSKCKLFKIPKQFVKTELNRSVILTSAILILLVLGSWVASTAGGNYNQGCSIGFPNGWPKCQGEWLPSFDGPGILFQMLHRFGAGIVGFALIMGTMKLREKAHETGTEMGLIRCFDFATGFWLLNVFVGGLYIVLAKYGDFPESLSLLHLVLGVASFLSAIIGVMLLMVASEEDSEDE